MQSVYESLRTEQGNGDFRKEANEETPATRKLTPETLCKRFCEALGGSDEALAALQRYVEQVKADAAAKLQAAESKASPIAVTEQDDGAQPVAA